MSVVVKPTPKAVVAARAAAARAAEKAKPKVRAGALVLAESPYRVPIAASRGSWEYLKLGVRWFFQADFKEASKAAGTWHRDADKHRDRIKQNFVMLLLMSAVLLGAGLAFWFLTPGYVQALIVLAIALPILRKGWTRNGGPAEMKRRTTKLLAMNAEDHTERLRAAGFLGKDQSVAIVPPGAYRDGPGVAVELLPNRGLTAVAAIKIREAVASAYDTNTDALVLTRKRGAGVSAAHLCMWIADGDPFAAASEKHPLLLADRANAWEGAAFGKDARGRVLPLRLMNEGRGGSHMLIGGKTGSGKSAAARAAAAPFVLDPDVRLLIVNGKLSPDWHPLRDTAAAYILGPGPEEGAAFDALLTRVLADLEQRGQRMLADDDRFPNFTLTEEAARDAALGMPLTLLIVDEFQAYTTLPDACENTGFGDRLGKSIGGKLARVAQQGRSYGVLLLMLTQKPSTTAAGIDTVLRDQLGTRFAMKTMDVGGSNMILGEGRDKQGYDSSLLDSAKAGMGILIPDSDQSDLDFDTFPTIRAFYMDNPDWKRMCQKRAAMQAERTDDGWNLGGWDDGPSEPGPLPQDGSGPAVQPAAEIGILIDLRDYLLTHPGDFHPTRELCDALGIDDRELRKLMDQLGAEAKVKTVQDPAVTRNGITVPSRPRQVRGYITAGLLQRIVDTTEDVA